MADGWLSGSGSAERIALPKVSRHIGFSPAASEQGPGLGFTSWFVAVHIDVRDEPGRKGKRGLFQELLTSHRLRPEEVFVVGENPDSEIEAGNRLGMKTNQILRLGVPRGD